MIQTLWLNDLNDLITQVEDMMDVGTIGHGPGMSILSKLRSIKRKLERGQTRVALTKLDALLAHLEELVEEGTLDASIADGLVSEVESIDCEADPECEPVELLKVTVNTGTETYTLYVHPHDQRTGYPESAGVHWGRYGEDLSLENEGGSGMREDFDGWDNTATIVVELDALGETDYAAKICSELTDYGGNWYLPSMGELIAIYDQLGNTEEVRAQNNFNGFWYWSSTEHNANYAWGKSFATGVHFGDHKDYDRSSCRCVRR